MSSPTYDITIVKGKTFQYTLRPEELPLIYKPISNIEKSAPVEITAASHNIPNGWRVAVTSVQGMREINAKSAKRGETPQSSDFHKATFVDSSTIRINDINSLEFSDYEADTGVVVYYTPMDLVGYTARMQIRATHESETVLLELTTENDRILIDTDAHTILLTVDAADTEDLDFTGGVYDLEIVSDDVPPIVLTLIEGNVTVEDEVTRG